MAAPSGIVWGSTVGTSPHQGRIGIYVNLTSTATQTTRHTEIWFWSKYAVDDTGNTFYYNDNATSATTSKGSVSIKTTVSSGSGWSTTNQVRIASYDYTFTRGTSADARSVAAKLTGIDIIGSGITMTAKADYTIPALASYAVRYNANGGSSQPGNQTKYYGKSLTLSSTKPTRTGYSFQGWATSASGSVAYKAGASYTANAAVTLYAVWKANTYTVSYNANGGTGQPGSQTKTYGKTLTLSSTKPTRTGYTFQGWATSASGSVVYKSGASYTANAAATLYAVWTKNTYTVTYNANGGTLGGIKTQTKNYGETLQIKGTATRTDYTFKGWATSASGSVVYALNSNYTANANVTLYAVWEGTYVKPTIKSFTVTRCNSSGTTTDDGAYARVKFKWTSSVSNPTALIEWKETSAKSKSITLSGTSGTVNQIIGGSFSIEKSYSIKVTVNDGKNPQSTTKNLPSVSFPIDIKAGGTGVAIGKVAETADQFDVNFYSRFRKSISVGEKSAYSDTSAYHDGKTGVYIDDEGYIHIQRSSAEGYHPYIGFYIDAAKEADGLIRLNSSTKQMEFAGAPGYKFNNNVYFPNGKGIYGTDKNGNERYVFNPLNGDGNTVIGNDNYDLRNGQTNIYGHDIVFGVSNIATPGTYRPYRRKGDTWSVTIKTAGYVSNSGKDLFFVIPITEPIIGSPSVSLVSNNGFTLRQNGNYTHGSTKDNGVPGVKITADLAMLTGIYVKAEFTNTTNVVNNSPIGVYWNGTVTLS